MDLREYLFYNRLSVTEFAKQIRYSRVHISQLINGKIIAGKKLAEDIEKATNGKVKAKDLLKKKEK